MRAIVAALILTSLAVSTPAAAEPAQVVPWRCDAQVVVGRIKTLHYQDMTGPDDILGHGRFDMEVNVKQRLRGAAVASPLPVHRIAHGQIREDVDFLMVLSPDPAGGYYLQTVAIWSAYDRPVLEKDCYTPRAP